MDGDIYDQAECGEENVYGGDGVCGDCGQRVVCWWIQPWSM